jgi:hypothetical protein
MQESNLRIILKRMPLDRFGNQSSDKNIAGLPDPCLAELAS